MFKYIVYTMPSLRLVRWLIIGFYKNGCGGGILAAAGLQGDNEGCYLGVNRGKRLSMYIASILLD